MISISTASPDSDPGVIVPDVVVERVGSEYLLFPDVRFLPRSRASDQRRRTLYWVMRVILDRQRDFFDQGEQALKPLTHRDVAVAIGVHESTISRVTCDRFVQTPRGVFPLRYFFSSSLKSADGEEVSSRGIKASIAQYVSEEDPRHPLTDTVIAERLQRAGVRIARRTVAKYRENLGISTVHARKRRDSER